MGDGQVTSPQRSFSDIFDEVFPTYLAMGMTYELFWLGEPSLASAYRKANRIHTRRMNEELWLGGYYTAAALNATVGNMFSKGNKHKYPSEPLAITLEEQEERRQREEKARQERMKAAFMAKALAINAKLGEVAK